MMSKEKKLQFREEVKLLLLSGVNFEVFERDTEETKVFKNS